MSKKSGKSIKEKRAAKKVKSEQTSSTDAVFHNKKR